MSIHHHEKISIEINGRLYHGSYYVEKGMIHVSASYGSKVTQLGSSTDHILASRLLSEIVHEHIKDPLP